jgi:tryptophan synthase alpha chain
VSGRIAEAFARAKRERRIAFIPYVMAGDPDLETTESILRALGEAGADVIELGVPYSDPLADGPTIAAAGARALGNGTRLCDVLQLAQRCAANVPLLLFTYFNPVYQFGIGRLAEAAAAAGVAGAIVPDCALEESLDLRLALQRHGLEMPLLVAPSTKRERAARIAEASSGFIYVVSRLGVTGAAKTPNFAPLRAQLAMLRDLTEKPLAVGFGLGRPEDVREVASMTDGVVVGSALIDSYAGTRGDDAVRRVESFVAPLLAAMAKSRKE